MGVSVYCSCVFFFGFAGLVLTTVSLATNYWEISQGKHSGLFYKCQVGNSSSCETIGITVSTKGINATIFLGISILLQLLGGVGFVIVTFINVTDAKQWIYRCWFVSSFFVLVACVSYTAFTPGTIFQEPSLSFGYSYILAWTAFGVNAITGCILLFFQLEIKNAESKGLSCQRNKLNKNNAILYTIHILFALAVVLHLISYLSPTWIHIGECWKGITSSYNCTFEPKDKEIVATWLLGVVLVDYAVAVILMLLDGYVTDKMFTLTLVAVLVSLIANLAYSLLAIFEHVDESLTFGLGYFCSWAAFVINSLILTIIIFHVAKAKSFNPFSRRFELTQACITYIQKTPRFDRYVANQVSALGLNVTHRMVQESNWSGIEFYFTLSNTKFWTFLDQTSVEKSCFKKVDRAMQVLETKSVDIIKRENDSTLEEYFEYEEKPGRKRSIFIRWTSSTSNSASVVGTHNDVKGALKALSYVNRVQKGNEGPQDSPNPDSHPSSLWQSSRL